MASSSSKSGKYDVFLSFRGDTRRNLTDYLALTLEKEGFHVFLDENTLTRGDPITPALQQAIKDSRLAAIIFSRGYAESRWCLEELVEILACKETMGLMVLPIFYDIDPTHVRHQTSDFEEAFLRLQQRFPDKVQIWKDALKAAAELAGEGFSETTGYEGRFIQQIVDEIARKLKNTCLTVAPNPVGIDSRVQEIVKYLNDGGSDDVRIIGIWGMGGLGKTTVAKDIFNKYPAIFNKYPDKFAGKSFLANVREEKLVDVQNILLYDVLRSRNIKVSRVDEGTEDIKRRLGKLRVLVIVDGVDSVKQLEALAIKRDSFGPGSRIIITTRDKHLLEILKADRICHLPAMNEKEALELLSRRAFNMNYPMEGYFELAREVVDYCGGLPLALEYLGSYLLGKTISQWNSALGRWKRSRLDSEIHKNLKISYDGLTNDDLRAIFLDISCFFTGMNKDYVMKILHQSDTKLEIEELHDQCLITVDKEGNLMMHGLIRDTGREIVRAKSPNNLQKRCRLWDHEDVKCVLRTERTKSGRGEIEGLALDLSERQKPSFSIKAFSEMDGLRLLKLKGVQFPGDCKDLSIHLSKGLRWLCWPEFPMTGIPSDFNQTNLVDIDLSHSNIKVWEDSDVSLEKLKFLNLSYCNDLTKLPDFSNIPNLERLILKGCKKLEEIPALPTNLEILEADECIALEKMPDFSEMSRMRELHLNHSPKLSEILGLDKALNSMTSIHMEGCTNLTASFKEAILKGWTSCGYGGIFLNGSCIPEWFKYVGDDRDDEVCFEVPQRVGSNFKWLTLCCVYSANKQPEDWPLVISVQNKTKCTALLARITYASVPTSCDSEDHYLWQGQLSNDVLSWQDGDEVKIFVGPVGSGDNSARVKKIAVDLVWDKFMKENTDDSHPGLYDLSPHQDWLSGDKDEARTSHDASDENPPSKLLRSDSVGGGDDAARTSHDASDENRTPKRGLFSIFSKLLPSCGKKTR
ncbi:disease resistance protein RUN1 [Malus domestica]|uniref:disease resistance protein RUN1 n=1 Tax=Malus domestica TaxID=3750 RepID=UPI0010AA693D|nr:disease resistance-like protein DSC1 [Malus domestica]